MEIFDSEEVQSCVLKLSEAQDPDDALLAWSMLQGKFSDLTGFVCLEDYKRNSLPVSIKKYTKEPIDFLVPYFETEHIYFLDDKLLTTMFESNGVDFEIDYTLMFDSNVATYINKLVRGEPLGNIQNKVEALVGEILHDDLNFDFLFYKLENIKNILPVLRGLNQSKIKFWRLLNKEFRRNLVSLQIFRSIDCDEYRRTSNTIPTFTYRAAARKAINFCYDFYASKNGKSYVNNFVLIQRMILLQLIGMVKIQISSNRSPKNKMADYFKYIDSVVGGYFEREAVVAHKYFSNRKDVGILGKIQKGGPRVGLLKKLDNIAWDMVAPRFMESLISSLGEDEDKRYFVPFFLTFDKKLKELFSLFPVKGVIYSRGSGNLIPIPKINTMSYFDEHGSSADLKYLHSESVRAKRRSLPKPTRENIHKKITFEYRQLRAII